MVDWLFKHCALSYLDQWYRTDRDFMEKLDPANDPSLSPDVMQRLAAKYMVARCFATKTAQKTSGKDGAAMIWAKVTKQLIDTVVHGAEGAAAAVEDLGCALGKIAPKQDTSAALISAASKFLWFRGHHNVRIYDKRAVKALVDLEKASGKFDKKYGGFEKAWDRQRRVHSEKLDDAVRLLSAQLSWSIIPPDDHGLAAPLLQQVWFTDRVFDKYLWTIGAAKSSGATTFM